MPELPEVETIRRGLEPVLSGRRIVDARAFPHPKFTPALDAVGPFVTGVSRRGKYLLVGLDDDRELVVHLGMTGQLRLVDGEPDPYERAAWALDDGSTLGFRDVRRFGRIRVVPSGEYGSIPTLAALGPEPFGDEFTARGLHAALSRSRARLKTQLLSQRPVAGVGNIYADEALWAARLDPGSRRISRPGAERLHAAIVEALRAGVEHGGTTLRDYRTVDDGEGGHQHHLRCYGRAGEPCDRCGELLRRRVIDGRSATSCPGCQRR
ncbi:MAG: bifunctional DNA-formamidopyrimidine glycosylase/DNA-(apurinic or apyrimidinic site) lyase [Actinomycetota bacterium]